jgi:hypothetical protein
MHWSAVKAKVDEDMFVETVETTGGGAMDWDEGVEISYIIRAGGSELGLCLYHSSTRFLMNRPGIVQGMKEPDGRTIFSSVFFFTLPSTI